MSTLKELILTEVKRPAVIRDSQQVIEDEVRAKSGVTGLAIKGAFKVVKGIKPTFVRDVIDGLLDEFVEKMEPFYADWSGQGGGGQTFERFLTARGQEVADQLLGVTDTRARRSTNKPVVKAYEKLRPKGKDQVVAALPRVAQMLKRHGVG
jgi:hypothetical protein